MPEAEIGGKRYSFPEGITAQQMMEALSSFLMPKVTPPPPAIKDQTDKALVPNMKQYAPLLHMRETPEQRRKAAAASAAILAKEAKTATPEDQGAMQYLMNRENLISTAEDPYKVARAKKPESVYTRMLR